MRRKLVIFPLVLALAFTGIYFSGMLDQLFYPVNAQPSADDLIQDLQLEWGEVTEEKIEIKATVTLYNKFPALKIFLRGLKMSIESRGIELGQVVLEDKIEVEPMSVKEINLVLTTETGNLLRWIIPHINDNEVSPAKVHFYLFITWKGLDLELEAWAKEITIESNILGEGMEEKIMGRLSGKDC